MPIPIAIQPLPQAPSPSLAIAPRIKPENAADSSNVAGGIRLSKEWVLPPRPKPGRKPSTETPPTKRKAQNRAAQRAFRERRAARVVELEERLQELECEKEEKELNLTTTLLRISNENQQLKSATEELRQQLELFKQFQAQQAALAAAAAESGQSLSIMQPQAAHHLASPAPSPGNDSGYSQEMLDRALEERLPVDGNKSAPSPASTTGTTISSPASVQHYQYSSPSYVSQSVPIRRPLKQQRHHSTSSQDSSPAHSVASPPAYGSHRPSPISNAVNHPSPLHNHEPEPESREETGGCGLCHTDGNCLCSDLGIKPATDVFPKRAHSPEPIQSSKRPQLDNGDDMAMDFTHAFQSTKIQRSRKEDNQPRHTHNDEYQQQSQDLLTTQNSKHGDDGYSDGAAFSSSYSGQSEEKSNMRVTDPCGFCSSGTPCICADAAEADANSLMDSHSHMNTTLPPLRNDPHSTLMRNSSINKLVTLHPEPISNVTASSNPPMTGFAPGTCDMCQRDPMQTLFCTSLASKKTGGGCGNCSQPGGCCGGSGNSVPKDGAFIPCSAAYQTLSRHKGFKAVELPSLVGKLSTRGGQVEVASVASILRELDRRLYN